MSLTGKIKGTKGSFVKHGIDVQEDQLRLSPPMSTSDGAFGVGEPRLIMRPQYSVLNHALDSRLIVIMTEPESIRGVLTTVVEGSDHLKEERVVAEKGN